MSGKGVVKSIGMAVLVVAVVATTGCAKKNKEIDVTPTQTGPSGGGMEQSRGTGLPDVDPRTLLFTGSDSLQTVYFDYDSFALRNDARATLQQNAEKIRQVPGVMIQIEGHCDERGTQEYNLALGEKRALAVRDYLMSLGVSGDRMITISYGEEDPAVPGHDESAWRYNRRAEFNEAR